MIDHVKVEHLVNIFTGFFVDLNFNENLKDVSFLEILLGFIYAYKKIMKSVEMTNILTSEQLSKITDVLEKAVGESVKPDAELNKLLDQIKETKEESNG